MGGVESLGVFETKGRDYLIGVFVIVDGFVSCGEEKASSSEVEGEWIFEVVEEEEVGFFCVGGKG